MSQTGAKAQDAPHPDDSRKPDSPDDIEKPTAKYMVKRAIKEFGKDQVTDIAAGLVYFSVLALFPGLIALVSLLGLFGQSQAVVDGLTQIISTLSPDISESINPFITQFLQNRSTSGASLGVIIGLLGALYSASKYVGAFSRAMNRIYEIDEGRPIWKLKPLQLLLTLGAVVLIAVALVILVVSGPVARAIGDVVGLGSTAVTVWSIAKWPLLLVIVIVIVAVLYYATPNVQQPKFRWMSMGALVAIGVWILASIAFAIYVVTAGQGSYGATYGALAGAVLFLLWLWITNIALLLGAEIDAEIERGRELQAGMAAEESVQLPPRDTSASDKKDKKMQETIDEGYQLRLRNGGESRDEQAEREGRESSSGGSGSSSRR